MRSGVWVLNIFAAIWGVGAVLFGHLPTWLVVVPIAISVALLLWSRSQPMGDGNPVEGKHIGRVVGISTAVEGVAIFVALNVLINLHLDSFMLPAMAIIVGLHFIPIARWVPIPLYYRTGAGLIVVGAAACFFPPEHRAIATGVAAAMVLWASGVLLTRRGRG